MNKKTILLIDDNEDYLQELSGELRKQIEADKTEVIAWHPAKSEVPVKIFSSLLTDNDVRLVVTDYDLTEHGPLGFFGATVVDWCQNRTIPVGDFSRGNASSLAKEPNLFELRVPVDSVQSAADYVMNVYSGFIAIREAIDKDDTLLQQRSPAAALALLLGVRGMGSQFSQYGIRYGGANSSLIDKFAETAADDVVPAKEKKAALLSYIMGHLLLNSVLRFPGPLMSKEALAAYLAVDISEYEKYEAMLSPALYAGPFAKLNSFYWTDKVDEVLGKFEPSVSDTQEFESPGERNRTLLEIALGAQVVRQKTCTRCEGKNGGFLCPFSGKTVCQLEKCSVVSNVWIPAGARISRFERDFYDEWAPILGM